MPRFIFIPSATVVVNANTFIGGVGATSLTSIADLVAITNLLASDISDFIIDSNNNVSCYINVSYNLLSNAFISDTDLTYYVDTDSNINLVGSNCFRSASNCKIFESNESSTSGSLIIRTSGLLYINNATLGVTNNFELALCSTVKYMRFKNATNFASIAGLSTLTSLKRLWIPYASNFSNTAWGNGNELLWNVKLNCIIYVSNSYLGALSPALAYAQNSRSATIVYVSNFTPPSPVANLSFTNVTSNGCDLNFTAPSSSNALSFYEVYAERQDLGQWESLRVVSKYSINGEITASGDTISGLISGTAYKIKIFVCDEFWNRSTESNEVTITTL
jgi:hypothetical protein